MERIFANFKKNVVLSVPFAADDKQIEKAVLKWLMNTDSSNLPHAVCDLDIWNSLKVFVFDSSIEIFGDEGCLVLDDLTKNECLIDLNIWTSLT